MRRAGLIAALAGLAAVVAGAVVWWSPWLTRERDYPASIPQPSPLYSTPVIQLRHGQQTCFGPAVMDTRSEQARFRVGTFFRSGQPLTMSISGPGYRVVRHVPGTYADNDLLSVTVPAPRADFAARVCLRNDGRRRVAIYAADDRTKAPYETRVDGRIVTANPQFAFFERRPASIEDRLPTIVRRMEVFRPGFMGPWLFWPLFVLMAAGVPLLALGALARAFAASTEAATPAPSAVAGEHRRSMPVPDGTREPAGASDPVR